MLRRVLLFAAAALPSFWTRQCTVRGSDREIVDAETLALVTLRFGTPSSVTVTIASMALLDSLDSSTVPVSSCTSLMAWVPGASFPMRYPPTQA